MVETGNTYESPACFFTNLLPVHNQPRLKYQRLEQHYNQSGGESLLFIGYLVDGEVRDHESRETEAISGGWTETAADGD